MARKNILVVEDEEDILELVTYNLTREGYHAEGVLSAEEALAALKRNVPDLIVLDLMLPGADGLELCRRLRSDPRTEHLPLVMLTAKAEDTDIVTGLELGADDYVTKPFSPKVLLARIRAVLRRKARQQDDEKSTLQVRNIVIHPGRHEVLVDGEKVVLTSTEFGILHFLVRRPGWVFTRKQIVEAVHGMNYPVTDRAVDFQISALRKKLGPSADYIETVRGVGYRFKE